MSSKTLSVGAPIEARCTKCRRNTNHIIVAIAAEVPVKVECNTCKRQHKFRPPSTVKTATTRRTVDPKAAERKEWQELQPEMDNSQAVEYSMNSTFKVGSLVNHPVFGLGVVQRQGGTHKVEVLFEDGKKTMRCK